MAKRTNPYINYKPTQKAKSKPKGYYQKIHLKLAKRVYSDFKQMGISSTWNESQKFASKFLYEKYKDQFISKINLHDVDLVVRENKDYAGEKVNDLIEAIVEDCGSVFKVPPQDLELIEWYDIGDAIKGIPGNIKIRVSGGIFGNTDLQKSGELDYHNSGLAKIVSLIRTEVENNSPKGIDTDFFWEGIPKVVPGRNNNGDNCNYFIDFVLEISGVKVMTFENEIEQIEFFGMTEEEIELRKKTKKQIQKEAKERRSEAKSKALKNKEAKEKIEDAKKRKRGINTPNQNDNIASIMKDYTKNKDALWLEYKEGLITFEEYRQEKAELLALAKKLSEKIQ